MLRSPNELLHFNLSRYLTVASLGDIQCYANEGQQHILSDFRGIVQVVLVFVGIERKVLASCNTADLTFLR